MRVYFFFPTVVTIDTSLGRIDKESFSEQITLELLVNGFERQEYFRDTNGDFLDISDLKNIELDPNGCIFSMNLALKQLKGTLDMQWLPRNAVKMNFMANSLYGSFEPVLLPRMTIMSAFGYNMMSGSVILGDSLPKTIRVLLLQNNKFSGTISFKNLPDTLEILGLRSNTLSGHLDLTGISKSFEMAQGVHHGPIWRNPYVESKRNTFYLSLSDNEFEGDILVADVAKFEDLKIFANLKCTNVVDISGNVKAVPT
mmetsp:Transcript_17975/g.28133  ORF Transcript_17975/g.28133 Transcript_17975/m.28133 type:complete len:256 (-) Transcript_17975:27-794(-)